MTINYAIKSAIIGLKTHKSRSILTILGIVIGITSIILVMSLGKGMQDLILNQIQGQVGSKVIEVAPGRQPKGPADILSMFSDSLKQKDIDALLKKSNVPHLARIMPMVFGSETITYGSETYQATVYGITDAASEMYNIKPDEGRFITEDEVKNYADVAVIGSRVEEEIFPSDEEALGQKIKIKGRNFKVVGLLGKKGQGSLIGFDEAVFIPYTTAQQYILGIKYFHHLIVEADSEQNVAQTVEDMKITLRNSHNITNPEKDDFNVSSQEDAMKMVGTIMSILTLFLTAIAAISLLVGGVGIMNIMLVSVTERTREIGLRKAVGATEKNILVQFLIEAIILTTIGGIIGVILGASFSFIAAIIISKAMALDWVFSFPVMGALLGLSVSALIGLVFGLYPARQASLKSPIESLRYE